MYNGYAASGICNRIVISDEVTFTDGTLVINIPEAAYNNGERYCIIVGQNIPDETTINASVAITIGDAATTLYPLVNQNGTNVLAKNMRSRTRYSTTVRVNIASGVFMLNGRLPCSTCGCNCNSGEVESLPLPAATTTNTTSSTNGG